MFIETLWRKGRSCTAPAIPTTQSSVNPSHPQLPLTLFFFLWLLHHQSNSTTMMTCPPSASDWLWPGVCSKKTANGFYTWQFCTSSFQSHPKLADNTCVMDQTKGQFCIQRSHQHCTCHDIWKENQRSGRMKVNFQGWPQSRGPFSTVSQYQVRLTVYKTVSGRRARTTYLMDSFIPCPIRLKACELLHHRNGKSALHVWTFVLNIFKIIHRQNQDIN